LTSLSINFINNGFSFLDETSQLPPPLWHKIGMSK
jgi:hypothetical protein